MAKRPTAIGRRQKSSSHKTAKRLAVKATMLAGKKSKSKKK